MRKHNTFILAAIVLFALPACTTLVPIPDSNFAVTDDQAVAAYGRVLAKYVNERGEVDFAALQADSKDLDDYVAYIARSSSTEFHNPNDLLAHYLNSYNALSMYNVIASGIPETNDGLAKVEFFGLRKFIIGKQEMSLNQYETDVIRPVGEPRVHFALNCSSLGCPALPRKPFTGANLDAELEREARKFFAEARNLRVDDAQRTVYLSEILAFYTGDFVKPKTPSLIAYVNQYIGKPIPLDYTVKFIDYDWTIANSKRKNKQ
ncbi:MAG: DUF547 domain-containing protein [Methylobacter sp.]|nr:MAG: DUF547 domain-containing protein [Methylobacter sp.]PPD05496.1 MAG: DUF547 domain-containing protein [Methylobacter sp.]PPD21005.1 MAG: DUF547 domain-containing protein [Methylobacter sp.]